MTNDKPTSLRMGFGYDQARAAGLGGVRAARSPNQFNKIVKSNKAEREALDRIRIEYAPDPDWRHLIEHLAGHKLSYQEIEWQLYWVRRYMWAKSKGFSLAGRLKYHWPG